MIDYVYFLKVNVVLKEVQNCSITDALKSRLRPTNHQDLYWFSYSVFIIICKACTSRFDTDLLCLLEARYLIIIRYLFLQKSIRIWCVYSWISYYVDNSMLIGCGVATHKL